MKTLLVTVSEVGTIKNLLLGTFWAALNKDRNFRVVFLTPQGKFIALRESFGDENVFFEDMSQVTPGRRERISAYIARNSLPTGTTTMNQMRKYYDYGGIISLLLKRLLWRIGSPVFLQRLIRAGELSFKPNLEIKRIFDAHQPDLVFSTVAVNADMDVPVLREARRRGIKTVGMVRGWDNFTTHGFLRVVPDRLLLQNKFLKEAGVRYQALDPAYLEVVGFPQNDWYFHKDLLEPRNVFLQRFNIDPRKRVILYGAMGDYLFPKEGEIAEIFEELVELGKLPQDLVMIFRAHPAFFSPLEKMKHMKHVVTDRTAEVRLGNLDPETNGQEIQRLIGSIAHSEMVITSGSTVALDAVALGKPAIAVAFEKTPTNYWLSARRFRHHYTHYEAVMATGGVAEANSKEELASAINRYLERPEADFEGRKKLREEFLEPYEGDSGGRVAEWIKDTLKM